MAVQIIVDFTDEQWEVIKEYYVCHVHDYNEAGEWLGTHTAIPTNEILATSLKSIVQNKVNQSYKQKSRTEGVSDDTEIFPV